MIWQKAIETIIGSKIENVSPVSGGDIASAYNVVCADGMYFIKSMSGNNGEKVLAAEEKGLFALNEIKGVFIPELIGLTEFGNDHFLIMKYIEPRVESNGGPLGKMLALLHRSTSIHHGWPFPNFIGKLDQFNLETSNWPDFWRDQRLRPQIDLARQHNLLPSSLSNDLDKLLVKTAEITPKVKPSLLHGDLWSGNVIYDTNGQPYFIDPAIYYGHREVDLAMMMLFGGFDQSTFDMYNAELPLLSDWRDRTAFYQIYYVLVHVNLFGAGYLSSLEEKVGRYA